MDAATGMHEDAAAWERMGEAFGVARRMVEVEGRETGLEGELVWDKA